MPRSRIKFAFLIPLVCLGGTTTALAEGIRFDDAIAAASTVPGVKAVATELESRAQSDRALPSNRGPLQVTVSPGRRLSPSEEAGTELVLAINQGWNLSDLSGRSKKAASAERAALATELRARALSSRIDAAQRWLQLYQAQSALALVRAELAVVAQLDAANTRARQAGLATSIDEAEASAAHIEAKRLELALEGERVSAALALSVAIGAPPDPALTTAGDLPAPQLPPDERIAALSKKVEQLPQVALLRLQSVAASARAAEQRAMSGRQISFGLQAEREASSSTLLFGTLGVNFGGADKGQRHSSQSNAEAERRLQEADDVALALRAELAEAVHELEHSKESWTLIQTQLVPASETLLAKRERELELGEGTILEVLRARSQVLVVRRYAADANVEHRWAQVHLWLLLAEIELSNGEGARP